MKLSSLIRDRHRLIPAEVEVLLLPGLPAIHVLGLPDQAIKESLHRVRSALKAQGFDWPRARQVLVNVRPNDRRKSSRGLELAIAAGVIWETGQRAPPLEQTGFYVYGELTLSGEVIEPDDLALDFQAGPSDVVLTGRGKTPRGFPRERLQCLGDLDRPVHDAPVGPRFEIQRPTEGLERSFTEKEAQLLSVAALGEFHVLLAGVGGAGKTTLARALRSFQRMPTALQISQGRMQDGWHPWIAPHHTSSALSLIGGGQPPKEGEISRAHDGILFLDELLEFPRLVQEALREPMEAGVIRVSRGPQTETFPAKFQLIGTTNLCPCGRWVPGAKIDCGRSLRNCRSVLERISGPFFDRFDLFVFADRRRQKRSVPGASILSSVESAVKFREAQGRALSEDPQGLWKQVTEPWRTELQREEFFFSERRRLSTLRVARAFADLAGSVEIRGDHVDLALEWTLRSFERLRTTETGI